MAARARAPPQQTPLVRQSLRSDPQWTEGLAMCIDRALDKAVWLHVAMYGYTTWTCAGYLVTGHKITSMTKALQVQPDPHKFSEESRFGRSREQDICYVIAPVAALPKEGRKIFVTGAVYLVTGHKIAPVGQARRTGIPIAKALRAGIFATSDEYTQREPTGVNEYDEPMPQAGFDPDPSTLRCPICFDTVCRPVVTLCLHVFCDECIYKSLRDSSLACPLCRASIPQPPEPDAILEGYLERAVAEGVVAVPSGGRSSPYTWRDVEFSR
ncbi:hypothetical protein B0H13DRAFT_2280596 [Mycena leptocephala]|nr:hypothetical protein B0H13DRAFT_2280596 [Mycena leptocephala]